jgi:hypothetical protein
VIFEKISRTHSEEKTVFSINDTGKNWLSTCRKMELDPSHKLLKYKT